MSEAERYPIPAGRHRAETEVRRSRFIATLAPAPTVEAAREFIAEIRAEFPDATHNCWAYVVGPPGSTAQVGMSDDGEPHGTAGRPMLHALLHSGVGDIAAVVTRYFGGVKLGTGGLVRAYAGSVQAALETMPRTERVRRAELDVVVDYAAVGALQRLLPALDATITAEEYGADVRYRIRLPESGVARLRAEVTALTGGRGRVVAVGPAGDENG